MDPNTLGGKVWINPDPLGLSGRIGQARVDVGRGIGRSSHVVNYRP